MSAHTRSKAEGEHVNQVASQTPALHARERGGGSPRSERWGIDSEYGLLRDVLLGGPDSFRWLGEENAQYRELALRQHAEMVDAYREAGVSVHFLDAPDELPYAVYARDSNFMTPFGGV